MKTKVQYKVKNWNAYDAALKLRGSITFWLDEDVIEQWRNQQKTGKKGASNYYSDTAMSDDKPLRASTLQWEQFNRCFIYQEGKQRGFWNRYSCSWELS
ncbi:transposase [Nostocaceae cyanobacterium CENA369]|uniref:Transposase n=1 Tax=Dendronalium phyllosphericum CENA369 TaxID=1725256 RepID=A0A8J7IDD8_9NOST|nr:transposase [Dendronalium phyllosphericum CENA369]